MRRSLFYILLLSFIFAFPVHAATYNYYFSNAGRGTVCSISSPCKYLNGMDGTAGSGDNAQDKINNANSGDTINLYFNRGDTWTMNTPAVSKTITYGLTFPANGPVVNINAYGSGDKPKFYGNVSDFNRVPDHNATTGPLKWNTIFTVLQDGCSIKNIHINGAYGQGIMLGSNDLGVAADSFTLENSDITKFGNSAIITASNYATRDTIITKNLIHTGQQLELYGKWESYHWSAGIMLNPLGVAGGRPPLNNTISYNVVYDIAGEGIHAIGGTIEYNIIGDTGSIGIYLAPWNQNATSTVVRYNFVVFSNTATSDYDDDPQIAQDGIGIADENELGDNSNASVDVYGNIVINRWKGIFFAAYSNSTSPWARIRIFNNTIIDSSDANIVISEPAHNMVIAGKGFIYNNASILYDKTGSTHASDWGDPADLNTYWKIDNNAFWTTGCAGNPIVDNDWKTHWVHNDPKLAGEEKGSPVAWTNQSKATYYKDITFTNVLPNSDSALINAGKTLGAGYETRFLTYGTDFSKLPFAPTFQRTSQSDLPKWSIGAIIRSSGNSQGFVDVPSGYWAEQEIYTIYNAGITQGYSQNPLMYRPDDSTTRAQMAIFLGKAIRGSNFAPPSAIGIFVDVPKNDDAADWIEKFYNDGITDGCSSNPLQYCPDDYLTRGQLAILLLRAKHGSNYTPQAATGILADVPVNYWAADWIEQLYHEGITTGCKSNPLMYCPDEPVTRGQVAVFIVRTFGL